MLLEDFELEPLPIHVVHQGGRRIPAKVREFVDFCVAEIEPNSESCEAAVEQSLAMVTSLNPLIGYENAARLAKQAFESGKTIGELCREEGILAEESLNEALDPFRMTEPQK